MNGAAKRARPRHVNLPHFDRTITLESAEGGTRLTWVGVFENEEFAASTRSFLEGANEQNLDRLAAELARGA
ncbi:MAG: SRPBCC family protein [Holophagaceae bacterium]